MPELQNMLFSPMGEYYGVLTLVRGDDDEFKGLNGSKDAYTRATKAWNKKAIAGHVEPL